MLRREEWDADIVCLVQDLLQEDFLSGNRYHVCKSWAPELTSWESVSSACSDGFNQNVTGVGKKTPTNQQQNKTKKNGHIAVM